MLLYYTILAWLAVMATTGYAFQFSTPRSHFSLNAIKNVHARQIIDSRGNPTVEVDVTTEKGVFTASVPSGASTGTHEAHELRDGDKSKYLGKGVLKAVNNVNDIIKQQLINLDETKQSQIDELMIKIDNTPNKRALGANAILGVSLAVAKAGAAAKGVPLYQHIADLAGNNQKEYVMPVPSFNVINGGSHAGNGLSFQEFMILPTGASSFAEAMQIGTEIYQILKNVIIEKTGNKDAINVGDEGGFAPPIGSNEEGLELLKLAIDKSGHQAKVRIGMDVASSEFYVEKDGTYDITKKLKAQDKKPPISGQALLDTYKYLVEKYNIISIEDPFEQDDWMHWQGITNVLGEKVQIVGDDLTVTNPTRIKTAAETKSCNALLLKVNQIGSLTESINAVKLAKQNGWGIMTSHRSGETEDHYIADIAVGLCAGQIKTGAPCRSERLSKYNQLLRIEEELLAAGKKVTYAGTNFRKPSWMAK